MMKLADITLTQTDVAESGVKTVRIDCLADGVPRYIVTETQHPDGIRFLLADLDFLKQNIRDVLTLDAQMFRESSSPTSNGDKL